MSAPERELKIMLTRDQYLQLLKDYPFDKTIVQTNVYYDTEEGLLKNEKKALRTRTIENTHLVTLKLPIDEITKEEFEFPVSSNDLPSLSKAELRQILPYIPEISDLKPIAKIITNRSTLETELGTFCLDENTFDHIQDYELEYEYKKDHDGIDVLNQFLKPLGITYSQNGPNKIARAINYKENL